MGQPNSSPGPSRTNHMQRMPSHTPNVPPTSARADTCVLALGTRIAHPGCQLQTASWRQCRSLTLHRFDSSYLSATFQHTLMRLGRPATSSGSLRAVPQTLVFSGFSAHLTPCRVVPLWVMNLSSTPKRTVSRPSLFSAQTRELIVARYTRWHVRHVVWSPLHANAKTAKP